MYFLSNLNGILSFFFLLLLCNGNIWEYYNADCLSILIDFTVLDFFFCWNVNKKQTFITTDDEICKILFDLIFIWGFLWCIYINHDGCDNQILIAQKSYVIQYWFKKLIKFHLTEQSFIDRLLWNAVWYR